jgi:hypothetical protein
VAAVGAAASTTITAKSKPGVAEQDGVAAGLESATV